MYQGGASRMCRGVAFCPHGGVAFQSRRSTGTTSSTWRQTWAPKRRRQKIDDNPAMRTINRIGNGASADHKRNDMPNLAELISEGSEDCNGHLADMAGVNKETTKKKHFLHHHDKLRSRRR